MLSNLVDRHRDASVAIVGSGPQAMMYEGNCDISIAVNGAALLGHRFNYFMCGDQYSHTRDWFCVNCSEVRIIAALVASMDHQLYPMERFGNLNRVAVPAHEQDNVQNLPRPVPPHLIYLYGSFFSAPNLRKHMDALMYGGTIACCAAQFAYIMGASSISLYGCQFSHDSGSYFYETDVIGAVNQSQIKVMDDCLRELRRRNVIIKMFGPTALTEFDEQC